jgi:hypothetical protein
VEIAWRVDDAGTLGAEVSLPFGTSGTFVAPVTAGSRVICDGADGSGRVPLGPGRHTITVTKPHVASGRAAAG